MLLNICGFEYRITSNKEEYTNYDGPSINYSNDSLKEKEVRYQPGKFLFQHTVNPFIPVIEKKNEKVNFLFHSENSSELISDPFAAAFYLLSRYEEYFSFVPDSYNRFEANSSVSYSFGVLNRALVNEWAELVKLQVLEIFPSLPSHQNKFSPLVSIDIDQAYAFQYRGVWKNLFSFTNNVIHYKKEWLLAQIRTIIFNRKDPYDTFSFLQKLQADTGLSFIYFINVGKHTKYDKNISIQSKTGSKLINDLKTYAAIGLHPSYYTNENPVKFEYEQKSLEKITGNAVTKSRQHYLKLNFPDTYRHLLNIGIEEDYTMGYASQPGFRAGTCTPFYWFDLENNCETGLKIFPITFMEGTFAEDLKLSPDDAFNYMEDLIKTVKKHEGCLLTIWHNHTVNDCFFWKGWKTVFEKIIETIKN